jgi:hypothetical protein
MTIVFINNRQIRKFMAAIDTLNQNIVALTAAVDKIPASGTGATETQVQTAADAVAVQTARVVAATTPVVTQAPQV